MVFFLAFFFIIFSRSTVKIGSFCQSQTRPTIFEIASDLNITIFPSIVKSLILHTLKAFSILAIWLSKLIFCSSFLLQEKCIPRMLAVYLFKLMHCMPQSATLTPFRYLFQQFHILIYSVSDQKFLKNCQKPSKFQLQMFVWFLTKKVVPSAYALYKKSCSNILSLSMFWFDLTTAITTSTLIWTSKLILDLLGVYLFLNWNTSR